MNAIGKIDSRTNAERFPSLLCGNREGKITNTRYDEGNHSMHESNKVDIGNKGLSYISSTPESKKDKKKEVVVPEGAIWASSQGELLDREFERLTEKDKLNIADASAEIQKLNDYLMYWNECNKKPFFLSDRAVSNAYLRCLERQKQKAFEYVKIHTEYDGMTTLEEAVEKMSELIRPVLINKSHEKVVAFGILHWMWQVKRRLFGMKAKNHLAIGFINEGLGKHGQGSGKTTFAKNLCKPFIDSIHEQFLFADIELSTLTDNRSWKDILNKLIGFLDDITCESRFDTGTLKSITSCDGIKSARQLGSNVVNQIRVSISIIFTANTSNFGDVIKDPTGNRRFLPIAVGDFQGFISEDFDSIPFWKMINHQWDCFVNQEMFREIQKEHMTKSPVELLFDMFDAVPCKNGREGRSIPAKDIKIVLNKHFPKEKFNSTQSVTREMKKLGYSSCMGGSAGNQVAYQIKFFGNSFERWEENFPKKQSDIPAVHSHTQSWGSDF